MASPAVSPPLSTWPDPVQIVQELADRHVNELPPPYVQPQDIRLSLQQRPRRDEPLPVIDLHGLQDPSTQEQTLKELAYACQEWGFFQAVNHGVPLPLMNRMRALSRDFFALPSEEKQVYANTPSNGQGYGSRMGVGERPLDWGDYLYLQTTPPSSRQLNKWPTTPAVWRDTLDEYCNEINRFADRLLAVLSCNLGLDSSSLKEAFGGAEEFSQMMRINFYPPCPQPELALGLYKHADPGGITILLQDDDVDGLQIHHDGGWITVKPIPGAFVVNIGDQIQVLSNGKYKSVEHRAVVNKEKERMSFACFCNPEDDAVIGPLRELVNEENPARYTTQKFRQYRQMVTDTVSKGVYTLTVEALAITS